MSLTLTGKRPKFLSLTTRLQRPDGRTNNGRPRTLTDEQAARMKASRHAKAQLNQ
jgi:hypothetical protein